MTSPSESVQVHFPRVREARPTDARVLWERAGRIAFGTVTILGALVMFATPIMMSARQYGGGEPRGQEPIVVIVTTWIIAVSARVLIGVLGPLLIGVVERADDRFLRSSLVLPAIGYALLLPLSL